MYVIIIIVTLSPLLIHSYIYPEIRVDWQMYNMLEEDRNVVDLITTIGPSFPRQSAPHSPSRPLNSTPSSRMRQVISGCGMVSAHSGDGMEPGHATTSDCVGGDTECDSNTDMELSPIVRVFLRGHEGVPASKPFSVHPTQMVCS